MPTHLKRLVRSRMHKTGESYATALRYVRRRAEKRRPLSEPAEPAVPPSVPSPHAPRIRYAGAVRREHAIDVHVASKPAPLAAALARLVAIARAAEPLHDEILFRGSPSFCIDGEPYCFLVDDVRHVTLGFCHGFALPDPEKLLEGRGKWTRQVKVRPGESLPEDAIARLVGESARRVRALRSIDPKGAKEVRRG